ncbi:hypothetical protein GEV33_003620 [Tenebrio molitor]|uniref:Uncharacterized protein n=1 Tax=Tenebrio molitor TaxID=7067 RepID=A0A8J6LNF9_TENMO|nr:hypothetical protein GEV33_003620 [Tenebrio molitor]
MFAEIARRQIAEFGPDRGVMKAFVARGVTLGPETSVEGHNMVRATNANYARDQNRLWKFGELYGKTVAE